MKVCMKNLILFFPFPPFFSFHFFCWVGNGEWGFWGGNWGWGERAKEGIIKNSVADRWKKVIFPSYTFTHVWVTVHIKFDPYIFFVKNCTMKAFGESQMHDFIGNQKYIFNIFFFAFPSFLIHLIGNNVNVIPHEWMNTRNAFISSLLFFTFKYIYRLGSKTFCT